MTDDITIAKWTGLYNIKLQTRSQPVQVNIVL